jgi:hypothetical protein
LLLVVVTCRCYLSLLLVVVTCHCYLSLLLVVVTCGFLLDLGGLRSHAPDQNKPLKYFLIPLMGMVKGEHHDRCHLLPCTFSTASGIFPYSWVANLIKLKAGQGLIDGPAISDEKGRVLNASGNA